MRDNNITSKANLSPVLFGDEWPQISKCPAEPDFEAPGLTDVKKWRLQTLLAVAKWGIPSLAFAQAYERMFGRQLDLKDLGFSNLNDMISSLSDIFAVQEPDDLTALLFPDHPDDRILHDARLRNSFQKVYYDRVSSAFPTFTRTAAGKTLADQSGPGLHGKKLRTSSDFEDLIMRAYYNRDYEFPKGVVLPGHEYSGFILPKMAAAIADTRGVYQAIIVGAANPNGFYINVKNDSLMRVDKLTQDVRTHFRECGEPVEMYSIPEEFIYPGFPCLIYKQHEQVWERGQIVGPGKKAHKVFVETVDYGGIVSVDKLFLYLMPEKFFDIPKQAVYVSLMGLKPSSPSGVWCINSGARVRSFSHLNYWLDILLLDPAKQRRDSKTSSDTTDSTVDYASGRASSSAETFDYLPGQYQRRGKKWYKEPQFEALVIDRHDDELSLYLDKVLTMETYAIYDGTRTNDIEALREHFNQVLLNLPRPQNPFNKAIQPFVTNPAQTDSSQA